MSALIASLQRQAQAKPTALALRSRARSLTYAALMESVQQAMAQLQSLQVEALGLYLDNGLDWVIYDLAALALEIRCVPLPAFFSDAQITHALVDAHLDTILFDRSLPKDVCAIGIALPGPNDSRLQRIAAPHGFDQARAMDAAPVVKISYTSGSTGAPKGIELEREFIERTAIAVCSAIGELDIAVHLSILPYATLLENIAGVYAPLLLGRCVHAEPAAGVGLTPLLGLDPAQLAACFRRVRPNSLIVTPQLLELLCQLSEAGSINPQCLVFVAVGGARLAPALLRRARSAGIPAYEGYGLTEFASVATLNTPANDCIGSVGKALPGVTVVIARDGEICLSRETAKGRRKMIRTGDLGHIDDAGYLHIEGRKSNLIVLANGRNVAPEWVEAELNASSLITQSFVFSADGSRLAALLVTSACDDEIRAEIERINRELPAYARLCHWHRLTTPFSRASQTLTANGRLRRREIGQQLPALLAQEAAPLPITGAQTHHLLQENSSC